LNFVPISVFYRLRIAQLMIFFGERKVNATKLFQIYDQRARII
jgi:hypothetical protein